MLKKTISWLLILALLCSCCMLSVFATEPTSDEEAKTQGYHFKVTASDGTVTYGKFDKGDTNQDTTLDPANMAKGSTVTLLTDVTLNKRVYLRNEVTIEGNGHTISGASWRADDIDTSKGYLAAKVTFRNVNFSMAMTGGYFGCFMQSKAGNTIVFDRCNIVVSGTPGAAVFVQRGEMTFTNSTFKYTSEGDKPVFFNGNEAGNGATVINTTFDLKNAPNAMVGLGGGVNNRYYTRFADAMSAAKEGDTVTLFADYKAGKNDYERFIISKNVIFDGNGHTVSLNTDSYALRFDSTAEVRNLNIVQTGAGAAMQVNAGATATVRDSSFKCTVKTPYGTVIVNGKLILESGAKVISEGAATNGTESVGFRMHSPNAELIVNDGAEITTVGNTFKANAATPTTITINGGKITTARWMWESIDAGNTLTIKGGTFISKSQSDLINTYGSTKPTINLLGGTYTVKKIIAENMVDTIGGTITLNGKVIFRGPTPEEFKNTEASIYMPSGNVATKNNSGVQFTTKVDKNWYDAIAAMEGVTINSMGTLIVPKSYVDAANGVFTKEAIEAAGKQCKVDIVNSGWYNAETAAADGFYFYAGVLVKLSAATVSGELVGIGYVTVTVEGLGTFTIYGNQLNAKVSELAASWSANDDAQQAVLNFFRGNAG